MTSTASAFTNPLVPVTIPDGIAAGKKTSKILINPMSGIYHCSECVYAAESYHVVRVHRATEHGKGRPGRRKGSKNKPSANLDDRLAEAVSLLTAIREDLATPALAAEPTVPVAELDEWKARARSAEKSLKSLRRILGSEG